MLNPSSMDGPDRATRKGANSVSRFIRQYRQAAMGSCRCGLEGPIKLSISRLRHLIYKFDQKIVGRLHIIFNRSIGMVSAGNVAQGDAHILPHEPAFPCQVSQGREQDKLPT